MIKITELAPGAVLAGIDNLLIPIDKCINRQLTQIGKKQEVERASDNLRSVLRAVEALNKVPEMEGDNKFQEFMNTIMKNQTVKETFDFIYKQNKFIYA